MKQLIQWGDEQLTAFDQMMSESLTRTANERQNKT